MTCRSPAKKRCRPWAGRVRCAAASGGGCVRRIGCTGGLCWSTASSWRRRRPQPPPRPTAPRTRPSRASLTEPSALLQPSRPDSRPAIGSAAAALNPLTRCAFRWYYCVHTHHYSRSPRHNIMIYLLAQLARTRAWKLKRRAKHKLLSLTLSQLNDFWKRANDVVLYKLNCTCFVVIVGERSNTFYDF